jgi:hypothetical protein
VFTTQLTIISALYPMLGMVGFYGLRRAEIGQKQPVSLRADVGDKWLLNSRESDEYILSLNDEIWLMLRHLKLELSRN